MSSFRKDAKRDQKGTSDAWRMFERIEKTSVLQEARIFNATPVNYRKCTTVLAKIIYLLQQVGTRQSSFIDNHFIFSVDLR
jgi:coatomer protein complex subunit gamma